MHPAVGAALGDLSNFFQGPWDRLIRSLPQIQGMIYDADNAAMVRTVWPLLPNRLRYAPRAYAGYPARPGRLTYGVRHRPGKGRTAYRTSQRVDLPCGPADPGSRPLTGEDVTWSTLAVMRS
ncbi:oxygenase MpaB family protein [Nocardia sp. NBC_01329]|uniref:oxygenase MpaB family protein n=1 Tax=Nocardia sp. NBC_01329 TaxID=2903594 RepID=UPI002E133083